MSTENKDRQADQLLRGISKLCSAKDNCQDCPFFTTECVFNEPKPKTWFDEEIRPVHIPPHPAKAEVKEAEEKPADIPEHVEVAEQVEEHKEVNVIPAAKEEDDSVGTWIVSTTMGSVLTKYVYICSKCGYRKESYLSITPMSFCPECEKRKANN